MPSFDVTTRIGKFFGVQKMQLVKGEEVTVTLIDHNGEHRWPSFNDQILEITEKQFEAKVKGLEVGSTELQVQDMQRKTLYYLPVEILESMPEQATTLGAKVEIRTRTS